jgi:soluble lytic murein transglycosylase-like protein
MSDIPTEYTVPVYQETITMDHNRIILEHILSNDSANITKVLSQRTEIRRTIKAYNPNIREDQVDEIERAIIFYSIRFNVPADLIYAMIASESNFRPNLMGALDDTGLMQIRQKYAPAWARDLNITYNGEETLFDITTNIKIGSYYLGTLVQKYDGDMEKALIAYNAGPGFVDRALASGRTLPRTYINLVNRHYERMFGRTNY